MKKIIYILLSITFISTNFYSFFTNNHEQAIHFLYADRDVVRIEFPIETVSAREDIIQSLIDFSHKHQINITQLTFFNHQDINIYTTNPAVDDNIQLVSGEYPTENLHISNRNIATETQIGEMFFPISNWNIRIYDFHQVRNVGVHGTLHITGATEQTLEAFLDVFSAYGPVSFLDSDEGIEWFLGNVWEVERVADNRLMEVLQIDSPLFMVVIFSFLLLFVGICFFIHQYKKQILLEDLWGYSVTAILLRAPKVFLPFFLGLITVGTLGTISIAFLLSQQIFLADYLVHLGINSLVIAGFFLVSVVLATAIVRKLNETAVNIRGKAFFHQINTFSLVGKGVVYAGLIVVGLTVFQNIQYLQQELEGMSFWKPAENIFTVSFFYPPSDEEIQVFDEELGGYRPVQAGLLVEREKNDRETHFFKLLAEKKEAFVMESNWQFGVTDWRIFHHPQDFLTQMDDWEQFLEQRDELYEIFQKLSPFVPSSEYEHGIPHYFHIFMEDEADLYLDRRVMVSPTYLQINPIYQTNGENVLSQLVIDDNTLNILVPASGKEFEPVIREFYKENWFYLHKIGVYNMVSRELGLPLHEATLEDLELNIIWTEQNQQYFTFNSRVGDHQNKITDPVAIVYTGNLDTEFIRVKMTNGDVFFRDTSRGAALENIRPLMEEAGINATPVITSVFNEANEELIHTQWVVFQQSVLLIIVITFALMLVTVFVWSYYSANAYEMNLKYLFGFSTWERNKFIIVSTVLVNVASGVLVFFFMDTTAALLVMSLLIAADLLIIHLIGNRLTKTNVVKIMKGAD